LLADPLEGVRSVGAVKRCQFSAGNGCEGPQAVHAATGQRCHDPKGIAGRSPGGRPLRRRRETLPIFGRSRLRGTAALRAAAGWLFFRALLARPVPLHFCADCRIAIQAGGKNGAGWALRSRVENSHLTCGATKGI
jgi:hypothetical protein